MDYQAAVIGGGFFGCAVALHLRKLGLRRIALVERESQLLTRASYRNQARVHNGYHYPRSLLTAARSRCNCPRFCQDYGFALETDFVTLYAVAAKRSKVTARRFEHFMRDIGARYEAAGAGYASLFDPTQIAAVFVAEEYVFNAIRLREHFSRELTAAGIEMLLGTESLGVVRCGDQDRLEVRLRSSAGNASMETDMVFNCTYAALNHTVRDGRPLTPLKHELAEIALVEVPADLTGVAVTVMDGSFFSCMPFPAERCHSLSHVRYTPHDAFLDWEGSADPSKGLDSRSHRSRVQYMIADGARMLPCLRFARWRRSLFEIKTVLVRNETDDGRPILLRREALHPRLFSLLGAKIDNIYDVLRRIDSLITESVA